jgi:hypothetical protein
MFTRLYLTMSGMSCSTMKPTPPFSAMKTCCTTSVRRMLLARSLELFLIKQSYALKSADSRIFQMTFIYSEAPPPTFYHFLKLSSSAARTIMIGVATVFYQSLLMAQGIINVKEMASTFGIQRIESSFPEKFTLRQSAIACCHSLSAKSKTLIRLNIF